MELVKIGGAMIGRATLEPGWKWSTSVQPLAYEAPHFWSGLSGILKVVMDETGRGSIARPAMCRCCR